jgi:hypothetical protein
MSRRASASAFLRDERRSVASQRARRREKFSQPAAPSLRLLTEGAVVLAHVEYSDGEGFKTRPAVVLDASSDVVWVVPITSGPRRAEFGAYEIDGWAEAGLTVACGAQPKIVPVHRRTGVVKVRGHLNAADWHAVRELALRTLAAA